jgi:hypothetical protein
MAAPIGRDISKGLEPMRDAVVDFLFVWIGLIVGLANTLGDHFGITLAMAGVLAVGALHAGGVLQEIAAKRTAHNIVELLGDEFVSLLLMYLFFLLADSSLSVEADIEWSPILQLLG